MAACFGAGGDNGVGTFMLHALGKFHGWDDGDHFYARILQHLHGFLAGVGATSGADRNICFDNDFCARFCEAATHGGYVHAKRFFRSRLYGIYIFLEFVFRTTEGGKYPEATGFTDSGDQFRSTTSLHRPLEERVSDI